MRVRDQRLGMCIQSGLRLHVDIGLVQLRISRFSPPPPALRFGVWLLGGTCVTRATLAIWHHKISHLLRRWVLGEISGLHFARGHRFSAA